LDDFIFIYFFLLYFGTVDLQYSSPESPWPLSSIYFYAFYFYCVVADGHSSVKTFL
jgi:hypothetical protein